MTDNPNVDPLVSEGAGGEPNPSASGEPGTPVAGDAEKLSKLVKAVIAEELKPIKGDISGLYSRQDKDRKEVAGISEFLAEFKKEKAGGLSDNDAELAAMNTLANRERDEKRDSLLDALAKKFLDETSNQSPGTGAVGAVEAAKVVGEYGLDANDAEVAKAIQSAQSVSELEGALAKVAFKKAIKPAPSPAGAPAMQGGATPSGVLSPEQVEQLAGERNDLMKDPLGNKSKLDALDKRLTEAGVPLD